MGFPIDTSTGHTGGRADHARLADRAGAVAASSSMSPAQWVAVAGGLGLVPIAPGTWGSVGGALLFAGILGVGFGSPTAVAGIYLGCVGLLFGVGVWASGRADREWAQHDDNRIVIDEVVGQLIALSPLLLFPAGAAFFWPVVTGFVLFRLFDVWKPGAIRWAERRFEGGLGVMADDVVAGIYSAVVLFCCLQFETIRNVS